MRICWPPETHAIRASSTELMPSVAMNESILARTISAPLTAPIAQPAASVSRTAVGTPSPWRSSSQADRIADIPTSVPTARLKTPAASGMVTAIATSAVSAEFASSDRQTPAVRNVSGTQRANSTNRTAKMYSALTLRNESAARMRCTGADVVAPIEWAVLTSSLMGRGLRGRWRLWPARAGRGLR